MFVNNLFFHDQGPTMSKNTKTKLACIIVDEKRQPKCFSFNRNLFFYYLFFSSAYILSTRAVMVRRNDSVFSLYKGHEITEPLVIHKTQRQHLLAILHCQDGSVAAWHAQQFHRLILSCL